MPSMGVVRLAARYQGEVITWSDHLDRPSRRRFESAPWASYFGVVDRLLIRVRPDDNAPGVVLLGRHERDFTARDRLIGYALRPHVVALVRQARRPPPPRGTPGCGRIRRRRRPERLRHSRTRATSSSTPPLRPRRAPRGVVRQRARRSTAVTYRRLARLAVARPASASRAQWHPTRRRGADAKRLDCRRGAARDLADGKGRSTSSAAWQRASRPRRSRTSCG